MSIAISRRLAWWLTPKATMGTNLGGAALVAALCCGWMALFAYLSAP